MKDTQYSANREHIGVLRHSGGSRTVPLINESVHPENQVRVYKAWEHNVEDTIVLALTITQKGSANINSVYVVSNGRSEEVTFGWNRNHEDRTKKTKDDVIQDAQEWMRSHPDGQLK